mmetsp:Transcript_10212/g.29489  ORF Transcript_10212/g.29489 Transcript_10212/m.29489 type:complete len:235 (+) Transcript_10212:1070-1774(+)
MWVIVKRAVNGHPIPWSHVISTNQPTSHSNRCARVPPSLPTAVLCRLQSLPPLPPSVPLSPPAQNDRPTAMQPRQSTHTHTHTHMRPAPFTHPHQSVASWCWCNTCSAKCRSRIWTSAAICCPYPHHWPGRARRAHGTGARHANPHSTAQHASAGLRLDKMVVSASRSKPAARATARHSQPARGIHTHNTAHHSIPHHTAYRTGTSQVDQNTPKNTTASQTNRQPDRQADRRHE